MGGTRRLPASRCHPNQVVRAGVSLAAAQTDGQAYTPATTGVDVAQAWIASVSFLVLAGVDPAETVTVELGFGASHFITTALVVDDGGGASSLNFAADGGLLQTVAGVALAPGLHTLDIRRDLAGLYNAFVDGVQVTTPEVLTDLDPAPNLFIDMTSAGTSHLLYQEASVVGVGFSFVDAFPYSPGPLPGQGTWLATGFGPDLVVV